MIWWILGCVVPLPVVPTSQLDQVCINEVMPQNQASWLLDGTTPDWVELHAPGDDDVPLDGWALSDDATGDGAPLDGLVVPGRGFLVLALDELEVPGHLPFKLSGDGDAVALWDPEGFGAVVAFGAVFEDFSVARLTDCCEGEGCLGLDYRGTPGVSNLTTTEVPDPGEPIEWLPPGSVWRYDDDGLTPSDWVEPGFDDGAWASGAAPLGYGDPWIVTTVAFGDDPAAKRMTTWFRGAFTVDDVDAVASLIVDMTLDDGAVVWLNGAEALRLNLPASTDPVTPAVSAVGDVAESTPIPHVVDPGLLVRGRNILAVEVHQSAPDSSDLTFDVGVRGTLFSD